MTFTPTAYDEKCPNCGEASEQRGGTFKPDLGCQVCDMGVEEACEAAHRREVDAYCAAAAGTGRVEEAGEATR